MSAKRLIQGGRINRDRVLRFSWDNRTLSGHPGDSLASALLANNEWVLGRSFKYHRPRGIMSAGVEESGAIVTVGAGDRRDPNVKATMQELYDGLVAGGQNAWPDVRHDLAAVNGLFSRFFAAGFYYKTFMGIPPFEWGRGTGIWMWYEKFIRRAAGMGAASREPDPDHYEHVHGFCDVLVVGAGISGMSAALAAAESGLEVVLVEQDWEPGGDLLGQYGGEAEHRREDMVRDLAGAGVRMLLRTTAFGLYDYGVAGLLEQVTDHLSDAHPDLPRQRLHLLRTRQIILATGAIERGFAFGNNDYPGVMTADSAGVYLNRFGILAGEQVVVATNNDSAYNVAMDMAGAGAEVTLLDARSKVSGKLFELAADAGVSLRNNCTVMRANGRHGVKSVTTATASRGRWKAGSRQACDLLLVSGGWSPVVNLMSHRGVKPVWDAENACFLVPGPHEDIRMAGSAAGCWKVPDCEQSGLAAGRAAARALGRDVAVVDAPPAGGWSTPIRPLYEVRVPRRKLKAMVDPQHDVTTGDVRLAHREGYVSVEHLKRYTTLGMATDGGKMGNVIGLALMAEALGKEIPEVGTTTFRPPYTPVSIGALRGRSVDEHFRPLRRTPMHDWNLGHGATMTMAGLWHRPWYFARPGEGVSQAYVREMETTRRSAGLCDVTSLGKIAVQGPDATELLNRVYTNPFAKLPIGKARYGIMLRDDGFVMDDGTTWRLADTEYFMTTTTAHAAKVMAWLEELLQTRWQELRVHVTSVSEQWAGCAVAGPKSRQVLADCVEDAVCMENETLPFMGVVETRLKGEIPCRIARISFSGELAYEAYVPSDHGPAMMELLWAETQRVDGCLYGLEALGGMRIEKGHVTGAELDGRVTIEDAGLGRMASDRKSYIGSALRKRPEMQRPDRPRLVGILPKERSQTFKAGAILCEPGKVSGLGEGWVTGVTHSPANGHWIGIGFIAGGHEAWTGKTAIAADPLRQDDVEVEIVSPHMYDPEGERMHG
ncbi:MAG: sarcosine oxidase subunit alpha family protein [Gammaproteobacteria bacterium]|nr:sarcosine oxidase subunit alpha family protein [Gammaproteobacteria bacterium]MYH89843.1 sarcosine oxidase subunit alpha family protein [Gammaproteobacteria bacterium]